MRCENLPNFKYNQFRCNQTASMFSNNTMTNDSCVDWNLYYTNCKAGVDNPFQGSISFDNIGLAWVAIFQVRYEIILFVPFFGAEFIWRQVEAVASESHILKATSNK